MLPFDFGIYDIAGSLLGLIEFQGKQHYIFDNYFGGDLAFKNRRKNDIIKRNFCKDNQIPFLEIPYTKIHSIELIVSNFLKT